MWRDIADIFDFAIFALFELALIGAFLGAAGGLYVGAKADPLETCTDLQWKGTWGVLCTSFAITKIIWYLLIGGAAAYVLTLLMPLIIVGYLGMIYLS